MDGLPPTLPYSCRPLALVELLVSTENFETSLWCLSLQVIVLVFFLENSDSFDLKNHASIYVFIIIIWFLELESHYVTQACCQTCGFAQSGLKFMILSPYPPEF